MSVDPRSVAQLGAAFSSPARIAMCLAMLDGRAWTAGELARVAGVARSTASEHVTVLLDMRLVVTRAQGRHTYVCLASPEVAELVEAMTAHAGTPAPVVSVRTAAARDHLAMARTCYDHLAGALGVALFDALIDRGHLSTAGGLILTESGRALFTRIGGESALVPSATRPFAKTCLDWTERRSHLAGHLGAVLLQACRERGWVAPASTRRALIVTPTGQEGFQSVFGVSAERLRPQVA
jgi:DNA-binding transcriptional ArsR family regulator